SGNVLFADVSRVSRLTIGSDGGNDGGGNGGGVTTDNNAVTQTTTTTETAPTETISTISGGNEAVSAEAAAEIIIEAIENALAEALAAEESGSAADAESIAVTVVLPEGSGSIEIEADIVAQVQESGFDLAIERDGITFTIPNEVLAANIPEGAGTVVIAITAVDERTLEGFIEELGSGDFNADDIMKVFSLEMTVDGRSITNFNNHPLSVSISNDGLGLNANDNATAFKLNDDLSVSFFGGSLNIANNNFEFITDRLSNYGIMKNDNLRRVNLLVDETAYKVNGVTRHADVAPFINEADRTLVPVRFVAEGLGADVEWEHEAQTVVVTLGDREIRLTIGVLEPGMDTPAILVENRTMIPLRFVSERLGANVVWDGGTLGIGIYK
ncbi:MAG: copper amine oxidase N-terminal domain-containing protein, partial [Defluviitaleaceae bacterium]|nr:copper amine oxidase N-terminal domain-containing protein [Defluviitaleaceae bacterium]